MKKSLLIGLICLTLAGCGDKKATKTVTCSQSSEDSGLNMVQDITVEVKDGKFIKSNLDITATYDEDLAARLDKSLFVSSMKEQFEKMYKSVEVKEIENGVSVVINLDINEMSTQSKLTVEELNNLTDTSIDSMIDEFKSSGYICK